eukprot:14810-Pelagococcus_subviridis.AAC.4
MISISHRTYYSLSTTSLRLRPRPRPRSRRVASPSLPSRLASFTHSLYSASNRSDSRAPGNRRAMFPPPPVLDSVRFTANALGGIAVMCLGHVSSWRSSPSPSPPLPTFQSCRWQSLQQ